jgi:hypothetical protein
MGRAQQRHGSGREQDHEEDVVRPFTVPGTGPGVGEQQCFIRAVGDSEEVHLMTVVAIEEGRFAETVNNGVPLLTGVRTTVEDTEGGSRVNLTSSLEGHLRDERAGRERVEFLLAQRAAWYVRRVKTLMESDVVDVDRFRP